MRKHLLLIGLRASGKSTLGAALATRLGVDFIDLDNLTARELGFARTGDAFREAGEEAFRAAELRALHGAVDADARVIALGGGTPTAPGAAAMIDALRQSGRAAVVFLDPPLATLTARLAADTGDRPSLTGAGVVDEVEEVARRRRPLYAALADFAFAEAVDVETVLGVVTDAVG
jgi:shikimate kinase